jgi:exopolysaccharide biosynthesis polyprenyl glycosylphosphotransferase
VAREPLAGPAAPRRRSLTLVFWIPAILVLTDTVAFAGAMLISGPRGPKTLVVLLLVFAFFHNADLYRRRLWLSVLDDAPAILGRALAAGAAAMVLAGLDDGSAGTRRLGTGAMFGCLALVGRFIAYSVIRSLRQRRRLRQRTLILGAGTVAGSLAKNLQEHPQYGLQPEGMLDDDPLLRGEELPVPVLGGYSALATVLEKYCIDVVIVTYGTAREPSVVSMLRACDRMKCEIFFVPRLFELHAVTKDTEVLWGIPLVRLRRAPFRTSAWTVKRIGDIALSALAVIALAPVLLLCAAMSRWETGSVLFRQTRIGLDARPFTLYKFCSLRPAASAESSTRWNIAQDGKIGRFGRFLRRTSLDELPQLITVLRGDMSLVGPRPERPFFVDEFTRQFPWYTARHRVPSGLTGWAQVHGLRGDTSIADRALFDNFYIENWSMWGDLKIMVRTVGQVLKGAGR